MKTLNTLLCLTLIVAVVVAILIFKVNSNIPHNLKYPFFASTRYSLDNVRSGPGKEYPIVWVYRTKSLPFKVITHYKNWYQIEDYSGKVGWISANSTSYLRTAITKCTTSVFNVPAAGAQKIATIDPNVIVMTSQDVKGEYMKIEVKTQKLNLTGWILFDNVWGPTGHYVNVD